MDYLQLSFHFRTKKGLLQFAQLDLDNLALFDMIVLFSKFYPIENLHELYPLNKFQNHPDANNQTERLTDWTH